MASASAGCVAAAAVSCRRMLAAGRRSGRAGQPTRHRPPPADTDAATGLATEESDTAGRPGRPRAARARHQRRSPTTRRWPPRARRRGGRHRRRGGRPGSASTSRACCPSRGYAAHAHVNPCGPTGDAAGPHFQNRPDPAAAPGKPSTDPAYANPQNEIWLDLRTDGDGDGESRAEVPFDVHRPRPGVGRDPRGRDDGDGARPGRLRRRPAGLHDGAVPVALTDGAPAQVAARHTGRDLLPARYPGASGQSRTISVAVDREPLRPQPGAGGSAHDRAVGDGVAAAVARAVDRAVRDGVQLAPVVRADDAEPAELARRGLGDDDPAVGEDAAAADRDVPGGGDGPRGPGRRNRFESCADTGRGSGFRAGGAEGADRWQARRPGRTPPSPRVPPRRRAPPAGERGVSGELTPDRPTRPRASQGAHRMIERPTGRYRGGTGQWPDGSSECRVDRPGVGADRTVCAGWRSTRAPRAATAAISAGPTRQHPPTPAAPSDRHRPRRVRRREPRPPRPASPRGVPALAAVRVDDHGLPGDLPGHRRSPGRRPAGSQQFTPTATICGSVRHHRERLRQRLPGPGARAGDRVRQPRRHREPVQRSRPAPRPRRHRGSSPAPARPRPRSPAPPAAAGATRPARRPSARSGPRYSDPSASAAPYGPTEAAIQRGGRPSARNGRTRRARRCAAAVAPSASGPDPAGGEPGERRLVRRRGRHVRARPEERQMRGLDRAGSSASRRADHSAPGQIVPARPRARWPTRRRGRAGRLRSGTRQSSSGAGAASPAAPCRRAGAARRGSSTGRRPSPPGCRRTCPHLAARDQVLGADGAGDGLVREVEHRQLRAARGRRAGGPSRACPCATRPGCRSGGSIATP